MSTVIPALYLGDAACNSRFWSFVCENEWWPWSHVLVPLTIQLLGRNWLLTIVLMYVNESVETFIRTISSPTSKTYEYINESAMDSLIGDIICGLLGIAVAELIVRYARWPYRIIPQHPFSWIAFFNLIIVTTVLVAPVFAARVLIGSDRVRISLAPVIVLFTYPATLWLTFWCYGWAQPTKLWYRSCAATSAAALRNLSKHVIPEASRLRRLLIVWTLVIVAWTLSLLIAYTHVFLQTIIHTTIVMGLLGVCILVDINNK